MYDVGVIFCLSECRVELSGREELRKFKSRTPTVGSSVKLTFYGLAAIILTLSQLSYVDIFRECSEPANGGSLLTALRFNLTNTSLLKVSKRVPSQIAFPETCFLVKIVPFLP